MLSLDRFAGMLACLALALAGGCSPASAPSGSQLNLWAQAVEITQATQTWVPVNESPLVSGP